MYICVFLYGDSLAPNENIVKFGCEGGEALLQTFKKEKKDRNFFRKTLKDFNIFSCFGEFCNILIIFHSLYFDC